MPNATSARALSFKGVMLAAVAAGLIAGITTAIFHAVATEPYIEQAVSIEEQRQTQMDAAMPEGHAMAEEPVVSRPVQRGAGLFVGWSVIGISWSLLFGSAFFLGRRLLPWTSPLSQGLAYGALSVWALGILPFLKYPANPPGVGEPSTIDMRATLYLSYLVLSVAGTGIAVIAWRALGDVWQWRRGPRIAVVASGYAAYVALLLALMPDNADPVRLPMELVERFRLLSLAGQGIFWLAMGLVFGLILRRAEAGAGTAPLARMPNGPRQGL